MNCAYVHKLAKNANKKKNTNCECHCVTGTSHLIFVLVQNSRKVMAYKQITKREEKKNAHWTKNVVIIRRSDFASFLFCAKVLFFFICHYSNAILLHFTYTYISQLNLFCMNLWHVNQMELSLAARSLYKSFVLIWTKWYHRFSILPHTTENSFFVACTLSHAKHINLLISISIMIKNM